MSAPTYPLTMPTAPSFVTSEFTLRRAVSVSESIFTGQQKVYEHSTALWTAVLTLPPMKRNQAALWHAFYMKLHGRKGTFLVGDPDGKNPQGSISGAVTVNGDHTKGDYTIDLTTAQASEVGQFKAGDYLQFGSGADAKLHMVVEDADSDSSSETTVTIEPALKADLSSGTSVTYTNAKGVFRMTTNELGWTANNMSVYGLSFNCVEAI